MLAWLEKTSSNSVPFESSVRVGPGLVGQMVRHGDPIRSLFVSRLTGVADPQSKDGGSMISSGMSARYRFEGDKHSGVSSGSWEVE